MSDASNPDAKTTLRARFSAGLLHQAGKGKFSTKRPIGAPTTILPKKSEEAPSPAPARRVFSSQESAATQSVDVRYKAPRTPAAAVTVDSVTPEPLPADRINVNSPSIFEATSAKRELMITAAAAKSLTKLFAALSLEPGSGKEVPAHIRTQVLDHLIRQSHQLAEDLCGFVMQREGRVPVYLRAKLLQQAAEFLSDQWIKHGNLDSAQLKGMAEAAFGGNVPSLSQDVLDLFHQAGEFTPADTAEISQARITEAVVRASWVMLRQVQSFDLRDYDQDLPGDAGEAPFSYGRDPYAVAKDLTRIALQITKENELHLNHLDLATNWTQNSIDRATTLVRTEYRMLTDRALRSSFKDQLYSEAAIHHVAGLYDQIISTISTRARNGFILVERNAIDAMAATAYVHYLPKNDQSPKVSASKKVDSGEEVGTRLESTKEDHHVRQDPQPTTTQRFSFFKPKAA